MKAGRERTSAQPDHEIVIIGCGFSGIGAAIELKKAGFEDLVILEMADDVGGAWTGRPSTRAS